MPKIHVTRSITINSTVDKLFSKLNDFNEWPAWSPWLIMEPGVEVNVADDAKYYEWKGNRVGEGNMSITKEEKNKSIEYDLTFLKPWKSKAVTKFELAKERNATKVTWVMDSSLPFFMFWMKKMMEAFIGMDYDRGLNLLKDVLEKGEVESKLEFREESEFPGTKYVGIKTTCSIPDLGNKMEEDFGKLSAFIETNKELATGEMYSIYHDFNMVKEKAIYTACTGVTSIPENLPNGLFSGEIPATKLYTLRHIGAYHHLGNAWSTLYTMHRGKEFKTVKGIHPFEHYINDPKKTPEKDLITDVCFAIK